MKKKKNQKKQTKRKNPKNIFSGMEKINQTIENTQTKIAKTLEGVGGFNGL